MSTSRLRRALGWCVASVLAGTTLAVVPVGGATAAGADHVVINEIYPNGGSGGGTYKQRFYELHNPTTSSVDVSGWSLQYRAAASTSAFGSISPLGNRSIPAGGYLLVAGPGNANNTKDIPTADVTSTVQASATGGQVALSRTTAALPATGALADANLVDLVGYGTATYREGASAAPAGSATNGITRNATHDDTDQNGADFTSATATPCNSAGCGGGTDPDPGDPEELAIAQIQGAGDVSPVKDEKVTTQGVVTAVYKTGGFNGAFIQTDGTNAPIDGASTGLYVFGSSFASSSQVQIGRLVEVTGVVTEFNGLTEITPSSFSVLGDPVTGVTAAATAFPLTAAEKEAREGMLLAPTGDFTITNNYATNQYAEIGLAPGDEPLPNPTNVVAPGDAAAAQLAENEARLVTVDDGASVNFFAAANQGTPVPWLTDEEVRVGQQVTFGGPVVLDFRNSLWKLQPISPVTAGGTGPVEFGPSTRVDSPAPVGDGTITIGTFNVLNYFPTTAEEWDALPGNVCTYYKDRAGENVTANECGNPQSDSGNGPRGAANPVSLARQEGKIVEAINTLDADVVSLEEIENSAKFGPDRDAAVARLVGALNDDAGREKWAYTASPDELPALSEQDVIRTAVIYQRDVVEPVGDGRVLVGSAAFANAREPYGQPFKPLGAPDSSSFVVVVNHFKSKGSGDGADADQGDGQGAGNASRTAQATALLAFADELAAEADTERVFLTGDFNAYDEEDPVRIVEDGGYVNVASELTSKETYQFDGMIGSLDHVFASDAVFDDVTGADIWNINSYESVGREYSRWNYNVSPLVDTASPFRASDHDPEIVAVTIPVGTAVTADAPGTVRSGRPVPIEVSVTGAEPTGTVTVSEDGETLGSAELDDGSVTIPVDGLSLGRHRLVVEYGGDDANAGSSTQLDVTVIRAAAELSAAPGSTTYGTASIEVTGTPATSGALFVFDEAGHVVGSGSLVDGRATLPVSTTLLPGEHALTVAYAGGAGTDPDTADVDLTIVRATPVVSATVSPSKVVVKKTRAKVTVTVAATGYTVDGGTVRVTSGSSLLGTGTVSDGTAVVTLRAFTKTGTKTLAVSYEGAPTTEPGATTTTVNVTKR